MWRPSPCSGNGRIQRLSPVKQALLAGRPEHVVKTAAFLVAMHDVGKVSRGFQAKVPDLWPQRVLRPEGGKNPIAVIGATRRSSSGRTAWPGT